MLFYFDMPDISIECGLLTEAQKKELIEKITDVSAETLGIPKQFFMVTVRELPDSSFGIGGRPIDRLKAEYGK